MNTISMKYSDENKIISGFSRMGREEKLNLVLAKLKDPERTLAEIESYRHADPAVQKVHDEISENTITNFYLPYSLAPNFLINNKLYVLPMVTEESSVVAAAAKSAGFWASRGGFRTSVKEVIKSGQVHFIWHGDHQKLVNAFPDLRKKLLQETSGITSAMDKRGGGIKKIELIDKRQEIEGYYQLDAWFDTRDSMGANFINTCLEEFAVILNDFLREDDRFASSEKNVIIIMAILSNYASECLVTASVSCSLMELGGNVDGMPVEDFAWKFRQAVKIAEVDVKRATTHNKGIFNGIDAVVISTGNDFRAVEAAGHAWAARDGKYSSLSAADISGDTFTLSLTLPMTVGTVGGLTGLHPLARRSLEILGYPDAEELMGIIAASGLATNFAAIRSLISGGIQSGHMRMHLSNMLSRLGASEEEKAVASVYFREKKAGFSSVREFLSNLREKGG